MEYAEDPLLNHVLAINRALDACWPHSIARMDDAVQLPESRDLIRRFVLQELHEVATLLTLIVEVTADLRSIGHSFEITRKTETPQSIEHD